MEEQLETLIIEKLKDELGFNPCYSGAIDCVECAKGIILQKLVGMLSESDWKVISSRYDYPN